MTQMICNESMPIFVVGAPRSGTTLMTQMLTQQPNIFIFNETLLYDFIVAKELYGQLTAKQQNSLVEHLLSRVDARTVDAEGQTEFGCRFALAEVDVIKRGFKEMLDSSVGSLTAIQVFEKFMKVVATTKGKCIWGDKTPNHVFHLQRISQDFPKAKLLYIVRDPRSFLLSYKFSWRQKGSRKDVAKLYHPLVSSVLWWRSERAVQSFHAKNAGDVMLIRYENLLGDAHNTLSNIFAYLGMVDYQKPSTVQGSNSSFAVKTEQLSWFEQSVCETVCCHYMLAHGYQTSGNRIVGYITVGLSIFTLPLFLWRALPVVRQHFQGGLFRYMQARGLWANIKR